MKHRAASLRQLSFLFFSRMLRNASQLLSVLFTALQTRLVHNSALPCRTEKLAADATLACVHALLADRLKVKERIVLSEIHLRDATCQWDHTVLSSTRQR